MTFKDLGVEYPKGYDMTNNETLVKILNAIKGNGGEIFVVGGPIRDRILGHEPKDIDFLVRKLTLEKITNIIKTIGKAGEVGQAFGIVKGVVDGQEFDFAIPRTKEVKTGNAHTDFTVQTDPNAPVQDDLQRRDFTWNAMALPLRDFIANDMSGVIDPNDGLKDLKAGVVNAVGDPTARFSEDPLRMIRAVQFATRMGFDITGVTEDAIRTLAPKLKSVSGERIFEELKKAWTKGKADTHVLIALLKKLTIGEVVFGPDFNPIAVKLGHLKGEDKIIGMFVAFFLNGGDFNAMKPDAICIKMVELAKNVRGNSQPPHTFIGNLKDKLPILLNVFQDIGNNGVIKRVEHMIELPMTAKELAIKGDEIISILQIVSPKDSKKIGIVQRLMLTAIWEEGLDNTHEALIKFCQEFKGNNA